MLPSAENVHTLGSSRSSGMIVAEYSQRLLTVLSRWLILHFSFALAVKLSCHFDVGTEIVLPFTGRNVLQCAANRKGAGAARA